MADYLYSDGNGNVYFVKGRRLSYQPVEPINSSSGDYSGGEARQVELSEEQLEKLVDMFNAAFKNRTFRVEKRNLGSAEIRRIDGDEIIKVILAMRSPDKLKIENYLSELK